MGKFTTLDCDGQAKLNALIAYVDKHPECDLEDKIRSAIKDVHEEARLGYLRRQLRTRLKAHIRNMKKSADQKDGDFVITTAMRIGAEANERRFNKQIPDTDK